MSVSCVQVCTSCVQKGGFEGLKMTKQRRINNRLLSYRPQHRGEPLTTLSLYGGLAYFRNCGNLWFGTDSNFFARRTLKSVRISFVGQANSTSGSAKIVVAKPEVQCSSPFPIKKEEAQGGR